MRTRSAILLLVAAACGGAKEPPPSPPSQPAMDAGTSESKETPTAAEPSATAAGGSSAASGASSASGPSAADAGATPMAPKDLAAEAAVNERSYSVGAGQLTLDGKGGRDQGEVKAILDGNLKNISACYRTAFSKKEITGTLTARITIEKDGSVSDAKPDGTTDITDAELRKCIFGSYKKLKFAKGAGKDTATQALFFGKSKMPSR